MWSKIVLSIVGEYQAYLTSYYKLSLVHHGKDSYVSKGHTLLSIISEASELETIVILLQTRRQALETFILTFFFSCFIRIFPSIYFFSVILSRSILRDALSATTTYDSESEINIHSALKKELIKGGENYNYLWRQSLIIILAAFSASQSRRLSVLRRLVQVHTWLYVRLRPFLLDTDLY